MDDETEANILPPDAHDLVEVKQSLIWEINDAAAYKVTSECRRDECQEQYRGVNIIGKKIHTVQDLKTIAYQIYESYYNNPRTIPFRVLQCLVEVQDHGTKNAIANNLENAAKLGCDDTEIDRKKRTTQEVYDAVLPDNL